MSNCVEAISPAVVDALRLGTYQVLYTRVEPHAAVDTTVRLVEAAGEVKAKGFGMRLDLDLGKVFKAAKVAVADKPDVRLELGDVVKWW